MLPAGDHVLRIPHGDATRRCLVHVPPAAARGVELPAVLNLHGGGATPGAALRATGLRPLADEEGFLLLCPEGTLRESGGFTWNAGELLANRAVRLGVDDVGFLRAAVEEAARRVPLDRRRVHAVGFSAGAMMVHRLAAEDPLLCASACALAGPLCAEADPRGPPVPVLHMHGTADPEVKFDGGGRDGQPFPPARRTVEFWVRRNRCNPVPHVEMVSVDVRLEHYLPLEGGGAEVALYTVVAGGHTWPGRRWSWWVPSRDGPLCQTLDATAVVWEFMRTRSR